MSNPPVLKIELALKDRPLRSYTFAKGVVIIGRGPDADIVLDNMGVSRNHARIEFDGGAYYVRDEGSSNGTFVNNRRIDRHLLVDGDAIQIGKFGLAVGLGADAPEVVRGMRAAASPEIGGMDGTMVLTSDQLARVLTPPPAPQPLHQPAVGPVLTMMEGTTSPRTRVNTPTLALPWILAILGAILVGMAIGAAVF